MPDSNQSPSDPGFLKAAGQSVLNVGTGVYEDGRNVATSERSTTAVIGTAAVVTGLAVLAPLPFTIIGAIRAIDLALNGSMSKALETKIQAQVKATLEEVLKNNADAAAAAAPAAG
jgi:hypothetical protein